MKSWNNGKFVVNFSGKVIISENFPQIGSFYKNAIEWKVMTWMFCNFKKKYKRNVEMKNVQEHDFCWKNDQNMTMSNMPK